MRRILVYRTHERAFADEMLRGIGGYAGLHEPWDFTITGEPEDADSIPLGRWDGDGVVLPVVTAGTAETLRRRGLPYVNVTAWPDVPTVRNDNEAIGRMGAEHLLSRGFVRFGFVGAGRTIYSRQRYEAFRGVISEAGFDVSYATRSLPKDKWTLEAEHRPLIEWLEGQRPPFGVMAANDSTAHMLTGAAKKSGWRIPEDMAVLGVDNEVRDDLLNPPLSSIIPDGRKVGFLAAEMLHRMMDGGRIPGKVIAVPPLGLVARRSTDTLGFDDEEVAKALRFIRQHPDRAVAVNEVLEKVAMSRRTLERRFAAAVGHSPWREIRRVQVEHVKRMLIETDWPVKRLVGNSGFPSAARLIEVFREETGETPIAYRMRHRLT